MSYNDNYEEDDFDPNVHIGRPSINEPSNNNRSTGGCIFVFVIFLIFVLGMNFMRDCTRAEIRGDKNWSFINTR